MAKGKKFDPEHKAWIATVKDGEEYFDVVVCVSGEGMISHSAVKEAFKPKLVKLAPLMHPVYILSKQLDNSVACKLPRCHGCQWENVTTCKFCKGWFLNVVLGESHKCYDMIVVASGNHVLCSEDISRGFASCAIHKEPFTRQIRIDKSQYVLQ